MFYQQRRNFIKTAAIGTFASISISQIAASAKDTRQCTPSVAGAALMAQTWLEAVK